MLNIPNVLSLSRILLVPLLITLLAYHQFKWALVVFVLSGVSDGLDGFLARVLDQKTRLGSYLDPIADKLLLASSFVTLSILGVLPFWITVVILLRDIFIGCGFFVLFITDTEADAAPSFLSKCNTTLQLGVIFFALLHTCMDVPPEYLGILLDTTILIVTFTTVLSGLDYIYKGICVSGVAPQGAERRNKGNKLL